MSFQLVFKLVKNFKQARIPTIKFVGPRNQLQTLHNQFQQYIPPMVIPSVRGSKLTIQQIEVINSGGVDDQLIPCIKPIKF